MRGSTALMSVYEAEVRRRAMSKFAYFHNHTILKCRSVVTLTLFAIYNGQLYRNMLCSDFHVTWHVALLFCFNVVLLSDLFYCAAVYDLAFLIAIFTIILICKAPCNSGFEMYYRKKVSSTLLCCLLIVFYSLHIPILFFIIWGTLKKLNHVFLSHMSRAADRYFCGWQLWSHGVIVISSECTTAMFWFEASYSATIYAPHQWVNTVCYMWVYWVNIQFETQQHVA